MLYAKQMDLRHLANHVPTEEIDRITGPGVHKKRPWGVKNVGGAQLSVTLSAKSLELVKQYQKARYAQDQVTMSRSQGIEDLLQAGAAANGVKVGEDWVDPLKLRDAIRSGEFADAKDD